MNRNSSALSVPPPFTDMLLEQGNGIAKLVLSLPLLDSNLRTQVLELAEELERAAVDGEFDTSLQDSIFRKLKTLRGAGDQLVADGQITKEQHQSLFWSPKELDTYLALDRGLRAVMSIDESVGAPPAYQRRATIAHSSASGGGPEQLGSIALASMRPGDVTDLAPEDADSNPSIPAKTSDLMIASEGGAAADTSGVTGMYHNRFGGTHSGTHKAADHESPVALSHHHAAAGLLHRHDQSDDLRLRSSLECLGILRPLVICGEHCHSPTNTIISGRFRADWAVKKGLPTVPVFRVDNLSANDEVELIAQEALADDAHRRLTQSCLYEVEQILRQSLGIRSGRPRSRDNSADSNGQLAGSGRDARTEASVLTGASRNGVADRQKVFGSPVSSAILKQAVDKGEVSLSAAAAVTRDVEKTLGGVAKVRRLTAGERAEGQRKVDEFTSAYLEVVKGGSGRSRHASDALTVLVPEWSEANGELTGAKGKLSGSILFREERLQVQLVGKRLFIGRKPPT